MALMERPESHLDAELNENYPHHIAMLELANTFKREVYRLLAKSAKGKYWRMLIFPIDFFHFHRWN